MTAEDLAADRKILEYFAKEIGVATFNNWRVEVQ